MKIIHIIGIIVFTANLVFASIDGNSSAIGGWTVALLYLVIIMIGDLNKQIKN